MTQVQSFTLQKGAMPIVVQPLPTKKALLILRALSHQLRQQLLMLIDEAEQITVTELYIKLKLEQSVVSQHLAILRKAGFVKTVRKGKNIYYKINYERTSLVVNIIEKITI